MNRIYLFILALIVLSSCKDDDGSQYSAIADFIGEWELEGRVLNDGLPLEVGEESLVFSEDNNFEDLMGLYTLSNGTESNGHFFISTPSYELNFENSTGELLTSEFNIYNGILTLEYINSEDNIVREVWRKDYSHDTE